MARPLKRTEFVAVQQQLNVDQITAQDCGKQNVDF